MGNVARNGLLDVLAAADGAQTAGASDNRLQLPARHGQNGRAIALGRKNYLFMGSEGGGKAATIAYTLSRPQS